MKRLLIIILGSTFLWGCEDGNEFSQIAVEQRELSSVPSLPDEEVPEPVVEPAPSPYVLNQKLVKNNELKMVDILFVFDHSSSMAEENLKLAGNLDGFVQSLNESGVDYNLCHSLSDAGEFEYGEIEKWDNGERVLRSTTPSVAQVFYDTVDDLNGNIFTGSPYEEPIRATYFMLDREKNKDCFREGVPLEVIYLTDENENNCDTECDETLFNLVRPRARRVGNATQSVHNYPETLMEKAEEKLGHKNFSVNAIAQLIGFSVCVEEIPYGHDAVTLKRATSLTGGIFGDLCQENYAEQLAVISKNIKANLGVVDVDCVPVGDIKVNAVDSLKSYQGEYSDKGIRILPALEPGESIEVSYYCER